MEAPGRRGRLASRRPNVRPTRESRPMSSRSCVARTALTAPGSIGAMSPPIPCAGRTSEPAAPARQWRGEGDGRGEERRRCERETGAARAPVRRPAAPGRTVHRRRARCRRPRDPRAPPTMACTIASPEATRAGGPVAGRVGLVEAIPDVGEVGRGDPRPGVDDGDPDRPRTGARSRRSGPSPRARVPQRVVAQGTQHLSEPVRIGPHREAPGIGGFHPAPWPARLAHIEVARDGGQQRGERHRLHPHRQRAGLGQRDRSQVIDDAAQQPGLVTDRDQVPVLVVVDAVDHGRGGGVDHGDRRLELVRGVGEEPASRRLGRLRGQRPSRRTSARASRSRRRARPAPSDAPGRPVATAAAEASSRSRGRTVRRASSQPDQRRHDGRDAATTISVRIVSCWTCCEVQRPARHPPRDPRRCPGHRPCRTPCRARTSPVSTAANPRPTIGRGRDDHGGCRQQGDQRHRRRETGPDAHGRAAAIPDAAHRLDVGLATRPRPELVAQVLHVAVDRAVEGVECLAEHQLAQLLPREGDARMRRRRRPAGPAPRASAGGSCGPRRTSRAGRVDLEVEPAARGRRRSGPGAVATPARRRRRPCAQDGAHAGDQLAGLEGLGHVVVGADLETGDPIDHVVAGREQDHRHRRCPAARSSRRTSNPERPGSITSSTTRSGEPRERRPRGRSIPSAAVSTIVAVARQVGPHDLEDVRLVVDDQDVRHGGQHRRAAGPASSGARRPVGGARTAGSGWRSAGRCPCRPRARCGADAAGRTAAARGPAARRRRAPAPIGARACAHGRAAHPADGGLVDHGLGLGLEVGLEGRRLVGGDGADREPASIRWPTGRRARPRAAAGRCPCSRRSGRGSCPRSGAGRSPPG